MFGKKPYLLYLFLFFVQFSNAQLSNFSLNVTKTNETCTANGTLSFSVSNTTGGATMLYSIFLLPNTTTPVSVQSATTLSGLSAGNYRVVATQSLGSDNGTQQQDITIEDQRVPLTFMIFTNVLQEMCGNDGKITVTVTSGTAVGYEIFSGPMIRPLQASNVFDNLTAGVYQIRVFDNCGEAVVQTYTLVRRNTALNLTLDGHTAANCNTIGVGFHVATVAPSPTGVVAQPVQIVTTVFPPSGGTPIVINQATSSGFYYYNVTIPFYTNQPYNYTISFTDGCGAAYTLNGVINNVTIPDYISNLVPQGCLYKTANFAHITALSLVSAPTGYAGNVPQNIYVSNYSASVPNLTAGTYVFSVTDLHCVTHLVTIVVVLDQITPPPNIYINYSTCLSSWVNIGNIQSVAIVSAPSSAVYPLNVPLYFNGNGITLADMPVGHYVFAAVDLCGNPSTLTLDVVPVPITPEVHVLEGCENGQGSLQLIGDFLTVRVTAAPPAYNFILPHDVSSGIIDNGAKISLDSLPAGNYSIQSTDNCNVSHTINVTIAGFQSTTNVTIIPNCGSFDLNLHHTSNNNSTNNGNNESTYWLQKYYPATNRWGNPQSDSYPYIEGSVPYLSTAAYLVNNAMNYNLAYTGHFRILKVFEAYSYGNMYTTDCVKDIYEFDLFQQPRILDVYTILCNSTFEVIVDAVGNSTLTYRIISKNGQPFLIQNGNSNLFSGLESASYVFQVEDACGNILNSEHQILNPNPLAITASPVLCEGENVSLTAPNFSILTYQWWKDGNVSTILSTSNSLNFPSFNSALNNGVYHVRITYAGNPNSCLNQVLDYTINVSNGAPHAGNDNAISYCGSQGTLDMATLLTGTFDGQGSWSEITSSGTLAGNLWNTSNVPFGSYQFDYTVLGGCNVADDALITVTIKEVPQMPIASVDPIICESKDLNLFATTVANGIYHWIGPNGFTTTIQNPTIHSITSNENGVYTVYAEQNGCQSGNSNIAVSVNPPPDFDLMQDCVGKDYQVWYANLNGSSVDATNSTLSWSGPNNYTNNQNPITITGGGLGIYSLTITNQYGCEAVDSIEVVRNICFIPNVITPNNDSSNENLDLTGFGVLKLEIYNRWGMKVYEKNDYIDEWHGQNRNGGLLPDSTYYYIIKLNSDEIKTGWIFLSRG